MSERIALRTDRIALELAPAVGGSVSRLDWIGGGSPVALFRPAPADSADPGAMGMIPLVPWSNRISGGGFAYGGRFIALAPNSPIDPCPIHGYGWLEPWAVDDASHAHVTLTHSHQASAFHYAARLDYRVDGAVFTATIGVRNTGDRAMPFGLGLHPWFPRAPDTHVFAPARGVWHAGPDTLPTVHGPVPPDWDFSAPRQLAPTWADNGFTGWTGRAVVTQPARGVALEIDADPLFGSYFLYTPTGKDFFCLEPVSHMADAHNRAPHELVALAPGESLAAAVRFTVLDLRAAA